METEQDAYSQSENHLLEHGQLETKPEEGRQREHNRRQQRAEQSAFVGSRFCCPAEIPPLESAGESDMIISSRVVCEMTPCKV